MFKHYLLSTLLSLSMSGALCTLFLGGHHHPKRSWWIACTTVFLCFVFGLFLLAQFDQQSPYLQFQENWLWITRWKIYYSLGIDAISLSFILLTLFITLLTVLISQVRPYKNLHRYLSTLLFTQTFVIGCFAANDAILFYIFWEATLLPLMLNIGIWGSREKAYAAVQFFIYTALGSSLMLIAFLYLGDVGGKTKNFVIPHLYTVPLHWNEQVFIFFAFFIAFAVKAALWPLHSWLPIAHTEAPTEGSMILAAIILKLGGYGLIKIALPIVPDAARIFSFSICVLSIFSMIYAGLLALFQQDMKKYIAYSSITHMSIIVFGIFSIFLTKSTHTDKSTLALFGMQGAMLQMLAHSLSTAGLFLGIGVLYQRFKTRMIGDYQGLGAVMPTLASFFMVCAVSNIGLPGTAGFIGEYLIIMSATYVNFWMSIGTAMILILSASYTFSLYNQLFLGQPPVISYGTPMALSIVERISFIALTSSILLLGIWPAPVVDFLQPSLMRLIHFSLQSKL